MKPVRTFTVSPSIPEELKPLQELAYNLRWSWNHATIELFRRIDSELWERCNHNPVLMLDMVEQSTLEALLSDEGFMSHLHGVYTHFQEYLHSLSSWFTHTYGDKVGTQVAYFSAEFGLTECLSIFAGGLGVLAGDHLKSASELGIPLVGVGLLYQQGYFRQHLNEAGWQQETYEDNDFHALPVNPVGTEEGTPLVVTIPFPGRVVVAQVWRVDVGRVPLFLLDTSLPQNSVEDRGITYQLYAGDSEMRIKQEILLGIGGFSALEAMGLRPTVFHMNEGHSAFLSLELIRWLMRRHSLSFAEAREIASAGLILTSHTPVPAGHDYFSNDLMLKHFASYVRELGLAWDDFMALGKKNPNDLNEEFCMTTLALRLSNSGNGVSRLHGKVTRQLWKDLWPGVPEDEIPLGHVTNGVHFGSWISAEMNLLYDRYLGPRWQEQPGDKAIWERAKKIAQEELWRTHERRRERMVSFVRQRLRTRLENLGRSKAEIEIADEVLNPGALTIGFARRFATYKRATLVLRDPQRLARILNHPDKPVQIIFAGKAHPRDDEGKKLIQQITALARRDEFRRRIAFVEEYDMSVARYLVQGVDLWLNTPCRPMEASGTSGMKAAANGVLNLSILDGWWDEAYAPSIGWAIGRGDDYDGSEYQNQVEAQSIYDLLDEEIVPLFYDRGVDGLPRKWIAKMKDSIAHLCFLFNTNRMVREYTERFYISASDQYQGFLANGLADAKALAKWRARVSKQWPEIRIESIAPERLPDVKVRDGVPIKAVVSLRKLAPEDVVVEAYTGRIDAHGELTEPEITSLQLTQSLKGGRYQFEGLSAPCSKSGRYGFTVRVLPHHPLMTAKFIPGLVTWTNS